MALLLTILHSAIFQAGSLLVLIAEVRTRAFLASLVPIIVNTVLNEHQLVLDIVAFVALGDFPRSRLSEKQRGKVLASWVSRRMRTIAQFSIRDADVDGSVDTIIAEETISRRTSGQSGIIGAGGAPRGARSLQQVASLSSIPLQEEPTQTEGESLRLHTQPEYLSPADGLSTSTYAIYYRDGRNDDTPTNETPPQLHADYHVNSTSAEPGAYDKPDEMQYVHPRSNWEPQSSQRRPGSQDYMSHQSLSTQRPSATLGVPQLSLSPVSPAAVDESRSWANNGAKVDYSPVSPIESHPDNFGGLRVMNRTSLLSEDDNWSQEALQQMNLGT